MFSNLGPRSAPIFDQASTRKQGYCRLRFLTVLDNIKRPHHHLIRKKFSKSYTCRLSKMLTLQTSRKPLSSIFVVDCFRRAELNKNQDREGEKDVDLHFLGMYKVSVSRIKLR